MTSKDEVYRAATLIGTITVASRLVGFIRILILAWAVGVTGGVAAAYQNANAIPNLVFELVAGGALAALVVPLITTPLARNNRGDVSRVISTLLTWVIIALVPASILLAVLAYPLMNAVGGSLPEATVALGANMLVFFAPQLPLYGIAVVCSGVLQSHRKFSWPAMAPLLSSIAMIGVYIAYAITSGRETDAAQVRHNDVVILGVGTTIGVVVLAGTVGIACWRLNLKIHPSWKFQVGVGKELKVLAISGVAILGAQQACQLLLMKLANAPGIDGNITVLSLAQTFFLLPWSVLAVPMATAAYPDLVERYSVGDLDSFQYNASRAARSVMLLAGLGVVVLAGLTDPIARTLSLISGNGVELSGKLSSAILGIAPGLLGYAVYAVYSRVLYASQSATFAALASVTGWVSVAGFSVLFSRILSDKSRTTALTVGWSIGMTLMGIFIVLAVVWRVGKKSSQGLIRTSFVVALATGVSVAIARLLLNLWNDVDSMVFDIFETAFVGILVAILYFGLTLPVHFKVLKAFRRSKRQ